MTVCGLPLFRTLAVLLCLLPALTSCLAAPSPLSGLIEGEVRLGGTVRISGDVVVARGATLTIAPGSDIVFLPPRTGANQWTEHPHFPGSELIVRGTLVAEGTPEKPITFRFFDARAPAGSWGGINLVASPGSSFSHCRFTQADSALHAQESTVSVAESLFEDNLVGIRFHSSGIRIENNLLRRNGTAIRFHFGSPFIRGNEIRDNGKGFFITSHPRDYAIAGNNIVDNGRAVVLGEEVPEDVLMAENYWGGSDGEEIEGGFFDGRKIGYIGKVLYRPLSLEPFAEAGMSWSR